MLLLFDALKSIASNASPEIFLLVVHIMCIAALNTHRIYCELYKYAHIFTVHCTIVCPYIYCALYNCMPIWVV